jgi:hypothetical protein
VPVQMSRVQVAAALLPVQAGNNTVEPLLLVVRKPVGHKLASVVRTPEPVAHRSVLGPRTSPTNFGTRPMRYCDCRGPHSRVVQAARGADPPLDGQQGVV